MATINASFNVLDEKEVKLKKDFCASRGYQETVWEETTNPETGEVTRAEIPNPETKNAFIKRKMKEYFKNCVRMYRLREAEMTTSTAIDAELETSVTD